MSMFPGQSEEAEKAARLRELMTVPDAPDLIREAAIAHGMKPIQVDGVAIVQKLPGTGGPADPSAARDQLLEEMKRDDIRNPNRFLERSDTALVRVRAIVPPGARRRDRVDLQIMSPLRSRATDLHGGKLEKSRLRHQQMLKRAVRSSEVMVIGRGQVITRADHEPEQDETLKIDGKVLSGGVIQIDRKLGLVLRPEFEHAYMASNLAKAVNRRFFFFDGTTRRGIAKAIEDDFITLDLHPRYRDNVHRMMEVVRAISVDPESAETQKRLTELAKQLSNPATAADAAMQLEAIGESAIPTLIEGTRSSNPELRFYAAEALAYLDRVEAIEPLEEAAREVPAFRYNAFLAMQVIQRRDSVDALKRLMNEPSLETRYGSFCAIRRSDFGRSSLLGRDLGALSLYRVASTARPAVVASLRREAEIVLFGKPAALQIPNFLRGPGAILLIPDPTQPDKLKISRFTPGDDDRSVNVDTSVGSVIEGIVAVGGGYGDVVAVLRTAKDKGFLVDQLAIDPLPRPLRTYYRVDEDDRSEDDEAGSDEAADESTDE